MIKLKDILKESTAFDRWMAKKSYEEKAKYLAQLKTDVGLEKERDDYYDYLYTDPPEEPEQTPEEEPDGRGRPEWERMDADEKQIMIQKMMKKKQMMATGQKIDLEDTSLWTDLDWYNWEIEHPEASKRKVLPTPGPPGSEELAGQRAKTRKNINRKGPYRGTRISPIDPKEYRGKPIKNINYHPENKPAALWKPPAVYAKERKRHDAAFTPQEKQLYSPSFYRKLKTIGVIKEILNRLIKKTNNNT
jgi:hypothetical protein